MWWIDRRWHSRLLGCWIRRQALGVKSYPRFQYKIIDTWYACDEWRTNEWHGNHIHDQLHPCRLSLIIRACDNSIRSRNFVNHCGLDWHLCWITWRKWFQIVWESFPKSFWRIRFRKTNWWPTRICPRGNWHWRWFRNNGCNWLYWYLPRYWTIWKALRWLAVQRKSSRLVRGRLQPLYISLSSCW